MVKPGVCLTVFGQTDVGQVRARNEDAFVIADLMAAKPIHAMDGPITVQIGDRGTLLAVSDGMGGAKAGDVASALTLHALRVNLSTVQAPSAGAALRESVEDANQRVFVAASAPGRTGMGATITAVLVHGNRAYLAEVGDSRAYLLRGDRLVQVTRDQSCVQLMIDAGTLTREEAEDFPFKNVIAQAIGTKESVSVVMGQLTLRRKDKILLCSDGLWGKVTDAEIQSIVAGAATLDAACSALVIAANAGGGDDNITVVLAEMDGEGLPEATSGERVSLEAPEPTPAPPQAPTPAPPQVPTPAQAPAKAPVTPPRDLGGPGFEERLGGQA